MRPVVSTVVALALATSAAGCGRTDFVEAPAGATVDRELELDDGDTVFVEVVVAGDEALQAAFIALDDGVSLAELVDTVAMGAPRTLVLRSEDTPVLVVEVAGRERAFIYR